MSRAGKSLDRPHAKRRVAANITINPDLRDWAVSNAERIGIERASLSELLNQLLEAEREKAEKPKSLATQSELRSGFGKLKS